MENLKSSLSKIRRKFQQSRLVGNVVKNNDENGLEIAKFSKGRRKFRKSRWIKNIYFKIAKFSRLASLGLVTTKTSLTEGRRQYQQSKIEKPVKILYLLPKAAGNSGSFDGKRGLKLQNFLYIVTSLIKGRRLDGWLEIGKSPCSALHTGP